ncbi:MAG: hypothetical protein J6S67_04280, partial [Methanobrevibacter sp.]|nr:hypothetical protein [Methanobrevibacter sp.]
VSAFLPGNYSLNVTFEGDDNYIKSNNTYSFEVFKVETALSGNLTRGYNVENLTSDLIVTLQYMDYNRQVYLPLAHSEVSVEFNGNNYTDITVDSGTIRIPTSGLAIGNYTAKIIFKGNEFYEDAILITDVIIHKGVSQFVFTRPRFDSHYGKDDEFKVQLQDSYGNPIRGNQTITVELNGNRNYYADEDGVTYISSNDAPVGTYWARITFAGNENYTDATRFLEVHVYQGDTQLSLDYQSVTVGSGENLVFTLKDSMGRPISGVTLTVEFNGIKDYTTDENGKISVPTDGLATGNYSAKVTFRAYLEYNPVTLIANFTVNKIVTDFICNPASLVYGEQGLLNITLTHDGHPMGGYPVNVLLDSRRYGRIFDLNCTTDENGTIGILLDDLPADEYLVSMIYDGNENFTEKTTYKFFRVEKGISTLYADDFTTTYNSGENFTVTLKDASGRPIVGRDVTVDLDGIKSYCTDENGQIHVPIIDIAVGSYAVNITFEEDWNYTEAAKLTVNVTINKITPDVNLAPLTLVYGDESGFNITLSYNGHPIKGNLVNVVLDSRRYGCIFDLNCTTDENGT